MLDDAGLVVGIVPESRNVAHRLIEEFMLAANEAVAKKLLFSRQPAIYRVHDAPDPDRLVDLREVLQSFGYELKGDLEEVPPSAFQRILKEVEGKPEERLLTDLLLRAQRKAIYSVECRGHYALAAPYYCHFTSPIRRYPDLIVHRQLTRLLDEGRPVAAKDFDAVNDSLVPVAKLCSERERRAEQAERESLLWKKIVFMKDKVGRDFDAFVTGVTSFGLFVMLKDFFVEGLVPVSALGEDFFVYEEKQHRLRGRSSGKTYRLGDELQVKLAAIDEVRRRGFPAAGKRGKHPGAPAGVREGSGWIDEVARPGGTRIPAWAAFAFSRRFRGGCQSGGARSRASRWRSRTSEPAAGGAPAKRAAARGGGGRRRGRSEGPDAPGRRRKSRRRIPPSG